MKKNVLFVDDEPNILAGLRHRLHRQRDKWEMRFVQSGKEALEVLAREPIDVIVSDMRMPEMDGAALLKTVRERFPRVVRIILSGQAGQQTSLRAVAVAHQFLSKPCEPGVIEKAVERVCGLQALLNAESVRRIVAGIDRLPPLPRVYAQLVAVLGEEGASVDRIADILKQDMSLCAKTLHIVNSAFFGLSRSISRIEEAVLYLGVDIIKQIALGVEAFQFGAAGTRAPLSVAVLQEHALRVASLASDLVVDKPKKGDAFVAGLLHDIGKLVLTVELPEFVENVLAEMKTRDCSMHQAETEVWGVTHAEVGGYLLGLWGLPYPIIEAVANHHAPIRVGAPEFGILATTHIANGLVEDETPLAKSAAEHGATNLDLSYLEGLGVRDKLPEWREVARRQKMGGATGA